MTLPPVHHVGWEPCWRLIPSRYAEERVFDRVTDPRDRATTDAVEGMTSNRQRHERGEIELVPPGDEAKGPGGAFIMAAISYLNPEGSRFSDGTYGVYYATRDMETSIAETKPHHTRFLIESRLGPMRLEMRALRADLDARLHDLRGPAAKTFSKALSRSSYAVSQELGVHLRSMGSYGIAWPSVRHHGGECAAIFRPPALSNCRPTHNIIFDWDGKTIAKVHEMKEIPPKEKH